MSRSAKVRGPFGDSVYDFQLTIGQLEELQELTDAGPEEVYQRVSEGRWRLADLRQTLRLALIGGGVDQFKALGLVERYAGPGDFLALKPLCLSIIAAALVGAPDEDKPKGEMEGGDEPLPRRKLRFGNFYAIGGAIGLSPEEVAQTSIWRLMRAYDGWLRSQGAESKDGPPSDAEFEAAVKAARS